MTVLAPTLVAITPRRRPRERSASKIRPRYPFAGTRRVATVRRARVERVRISPAVRNDNALRAGLHPCWLSPDEDRRLQQQPAARRSDLRLSRPADRESQHPAL